MISVLACSNGEIFKGAQMSFQPPFLPQKNSAYIHTNILVILLSWTECSTSWFLLLPCWQEQENKSLSQQLSVQNLVPQSVKQKLSCMGMRLLHKHLLGLKHSNMAICRNLMISTYRTYSTHTGWLLLPKKLESPTLQQQSLEEKQVTNVLRNHTIDKPIWILKLYTV